MKEALVYKNITLVGRLILTDQKEYIFRYEDDYFKDSEQQGISVTLPKSSQEYRSNVLFPFFFNMLAEGANKRVQARQLQIDENDNLSLLLATADVDTIGAVTIKQVQ